MASSTSPPVSHLGHTGRLLPSGGVESSSFLPKGACRRRFHLRKELSRSPFPLQAGSKPQVWPSAQNVIQLHRIIKAADDVSRVLEGVVDMQAATGGLPALRWFIGYDTDGEPMFCGNQLYITCPHRLDCARCGMFICGDQDPPLPERINT